MERGDFVAEAKMEVGPKETFFVSLGRGYPGKQIVEHYGFIEERATPTWGACASPWSGWKIPLHGPDSPARARSSEDRAGG